MASKKIKEVEVSQYGNGDKVPKKYIPEGFNSQEEFLEEMRNEHQDDLDYDRKNREEALDDKKFAAGEQWDEMVLQQRKGLPNLVINSIPQFTAQLVGDWREERPSIKIVPAEDGDKEIASVRSDLVRSIETSSRASRVYDSGFESMVQCGDGAWRVAVEYAKDDVFDQVIKIKPIDDALSVVWDRFSVDPTGRDARHVFVDDIIPRKEFDKKWPEHDPSTLSDREQGILKDFGWVEENGVRITEYWRLIERDKVLVMFENGSVHSVETDDDIEELIAFNGTPIKTRVSPCVYAQMHLVTGHAILDGPFEYKLNRVPVIRCTGRIVNIAGERVRYGLVRFMKDPVRLRNFWRSTAAEQLGYAPKAQWMATESAVEGRESKLRQAHLSRDPLLIFNDEAIFGQNVQRLDPPIPQAALLQESQVNAQDMKDVTGIHDASLGIRSNETSGKAIQSRQHEGDIASLAYYDNGNASVLETGDVVNQLISTVYDGTRIIRLIGEDQATRYAKVNVPNDPNSPDLSINNYDVALSTGPSYTTRRAQAADAMIQAVQVWPEIMQIAGDLVVKAQDWPGAEQLSERLQKTIPPQFLNEEDRAESQIKVPTPEELQAINDQMAQLQEQVQKLSQENQTLKNDIQIDLLKNKVDEYNAITQRIRALSDHEVDQANVKTQAFKEMVNAENLNSSEGSFSSSTSDTSQ